MYHCKRFRKLILEYKHPKPVAKDQNLLILDLQDVFEYMNTMNTKEIKKQIKAEVMTVNTKKLMKRIKAMN